MIKRDNISNTYNFYSRKTDKPVQKSSYLKLIREYNKFLMDHVLDGHEVVFPHGLGSLQVSGKKIEIKFTPEGRPLNLPPDWRLTKKLWDSNEEAKKNKQLVYHSNPHTNGIRYKFIWFKDRYKIENKMIFSLKVSKIARNKLAERIIAGKEYKVVY